MYILCVYKWFLVKKAVAAQYKVLFECLTMMVSLASCFPLFCNKFSLLKVLLISFKVCDTE